jgi:hypothetical protein
MQLAPRRRSSTSGQLSIGFDTEHLLGRTQGANRSSSGSLVEGRMPASITANQVWEELERQLFAVIGMVTPSGQARTAGIVYVVRDRSLYFATSREAWKTKHIAKHSQVSLTVTIPKRIPLMPWIKIPSATITFQGEASIHGVEDVDPGIHEALTTDLEIDQDFVANACVIQIRPMGQFLTYGVGVPLPTMRKPHEAGARISISNGSGG